MCTFILDIDPNVKEFLPQFAEDNPDIMRAIDIDTDTCPDLYCGACPVLDFLTDDSIR